MHLLSQWSPGALLPPVPSPGTATGHYPDGHDDFGLPVDLFSEQGLFMVFNSYGDGEPSKRELVCSIFYLRIFMEFLKMAI